MTICIVAVIAMLGSIEPSRAGGFPASALQSTLSVLPQRQGVSADASRPEEPEGSGIAVFDGTYVATAAHVLTGARQVFVRLHDGRVLPAQVVGQDGLTDIALLKLPLSIPPFVLSQPPEIGDPVCSIGNQFGLGLSVTCGVVLALHLANTGFNPIEDFIQTDAVVNPGASGGALIDKEGRLVGLLSGIFTKDSDANIGVNFAVHTGLLVRVLEDLRDHGRVISVKSGMVVRALDMAEQETHAGVRIAQVATDGAAWRAGLRPDDIIIAMAGRDILYPGHVSAIIYEHRPGDTVPIDIIRDGGRQDLQLELVKDE